MLYPVFSKLHIYHSIQKPWIITYKTHRRCCILFLEISSSPRSGIYLSVCTYHSPIYSLNKYYYKSHQVTGTVLSTLQILMHLILIMFPKCWHCYYNYFLEWPWTNSLYYLLKIEDKTCFINILKKYMIGLNTSPKRLKIMHYE